MRIRQIISEDKKKVTTVSRELTVEQAVTVMGTQKCSALIVEDSGIPVGIFTERDLFKCCTRYPHRLFSELRIDEAMTNKLIYAVGEDDVVDMLLLMIKSGIHHLPVIENDRVCGMLTLVELVNNELLTLKHEIDHLQAYINDLQEARND
jgi:CBS domain-containing protein